MKLSDVKNKIDKYFDSYTPGEIVNNLSKTMKMADKKKYKLVSVCCDADVESIGGIPCCTNCEKEYPKTHMINI